MVMSKEKIESELERAKKHLDKQFLSEVRVFFVGYIQALEDVLNDN